jgi:LacI family transcriptional regulator
VTRKTNTIGLIIKDISNPFFADLARGVDDEAHEQGRNIIYSKSSDNAERDINSINILCARGVDALILAMASDIDDDKRNEYRKIISDVSIPIILVDSHDRSLSCSCVELNNKKGAYIAASHLLSLGHRKIACITGPSGMRATKERLEGLRWALNDAGIPFDEEYIFEGNCYHLSGYEAAKKIIDTDATAIFAFNDMMAFGAFRLMRQAGFSIPNDISVVGFDDVYFSELFEVPLTTVRQPAYEIGCQAVQRAILEMENKNTIKQNIFLSQSLLSEKHCKMQDPRKT